MFCHAAPQVCLYEGSYHHLVSLFINIVFHFPSVEIIVSPKGHLLKPQEESFFSN